MKNIFLIASLLSFVLLSFGQTELDLNNSAGDKLKVAEQNLELVYSKIEKAYSTDTLFLKKLAVSQTVWKQYKTAQLELKFPEPDKQYYGSIYPVCAAQFLEQMTKERTAVLNLWLTAPEEGDCCSGSVKASAINKLK